MKQKLLDEDILEMRKLYWRFTRAEITLADLKERVDEIAGRQMHLPTEELQEAEKWR